MGLNIIAPHKVHFCCFSNNYTLSSFLDVRVNLTQSSYYKVGEDKLIVGLTLSNPSSSPITLRVQSTELTATGKDHCIHNIYFTWFNHKGGADYTSGPYNVTFPAGMTEASLNILITKDGILERSENFTLSLSEPTLDRVFLSDPKQATVTIIDNDSK